MAEPVKARCVHCRAEVLVPETYQHGDHIKCGSCGMRHKVVRGEREGVRLVIADVTPLRDALRANETLVGRLEDELRGARHSIGLGANGLGIGVAYLMWKVAFNDLPFSAELVKEAVMMGVASGIALELLNYLFLAKRQAMRRISRDLDDARAEGRALQQKIREASRL
jgi:DNA-directed RNA polymerase subunit RPC12/RpoP